MSGGTALLVEMPDARALAGLEALEERRVLLAINAAIGKRVEVEIRAYFLTRPSNKRGWKSTGFWRRRLRNATALTGYDTKGATVTIADQAMNQKVHGGELVPREAKFLAIPAQPAAYGRSPRTFDNLQFVPLPNKGKCVGMLVKVLDGWTARGGRVRASRARGSKGNDVMYWCMSSVTQDADPQALPDEARMVEWISDTTGKTMNRLLKEASKR